MAVNDTLFSVDVLLDNTDVTLKMFMEREDIVLRALGVAGVNNAIDEVNKLVYDTPQSPNYKRTGYLRQSINHVEQDDSALIGAGAKYAKYVELGTSKMKPRPFLRNAILNHVGEYQKIINNGFSN